MAEQLASMVNTGMNSALSRAAMRGGNAENFTPILNGRSMRAPLQKIFIFSVAKRSFEVRHMLFPRLHLKGCEAGERYVLCTSIPDPVPQPCPDEARGGTRIDDNDGWIVAVDMLSPNNFTLDPYIGSANPDWAANRNGNNYMAEGVFPSFNQKPTEEELRRAEKARDDHYRWLTREALKLAAKSKKDLNEFIDRYPDVNTAMDALNITSDWHTASVVTMSCPNCGDSIKQGLAFHKSSVTDRICVLDAMKAYRAKAITRDEYEELTGEKLPGRRASTE